MGLGKTYSTQYLADSNNNTGAAGQVLISTATGINWSDANTIGNGPYLPLTAGSSYPLTGDLYVSDDVLPVTNIASNLGSSTNSFLYTHTYVIQSAGVLQLNTGGTERMRITSGGNVGIGTTSPNGKLDVNGIVKIGNVTTGLSMNGSSATEFLISGADTGGNAWNSIHIKADGNDGLFIEKDTNNVGIGTTSPARRLDVRTGSFNSAIAQFTGASNDRGLLISTFQRASNDDSVDFNAQYSGLGAMTFSIAGSEKMRVHSTGNVGIGTTSPGEKLEVSGNIKATRVISNIIRDTNGNGQLITTVVNASNTSTIVGNTATANTLSLGVKSSGDVLVPNGNVGIGTTSPLVKLQVYGNPMPATADAASVEDMLTLYRNGSSSVWAGGASLSLGRYSAGGSSPKSRLDFKLKAAAGSNTALPELTVMTMNSDGRVGIGTTSPAAKLDVVTDDAVTNNSTNVLNITHTSTGTTANGFGAGLGFFTENSTYSSINEVGRIEVIETDEVSLNDDMLFYTKGNNILGERMRIDSDGNVGIGTTSPDFKLDVAGDVRIEGDSGLYFGDTGTSPKWGMASTGLDLLINNSTTNGDVVFLNDGGVGIGVSSPTTKFEVAGTITSTGNLTAYNANPSINIGHDGNSAYIAAGMNSSGGDSPIVFSIGNNNVAAKIVANGNVGIGTSSPYGKLDVAGDIRLQSDNNIHFGGTGSIPIWTAGVDNTTNNNFLIGGVSYYSGDRDILLTPVNNGNVGIRTTSPATTLDVLGTYRQINPGAGAAGGTVIARTLTYSTSPYGLVTRGYNNGLFTIQCERESNAGENFNMALQPTGGDLGVGTTSPSYKLDVSGNGRFTSTVTATNFILSSDKRLKNNIKEVSSNHIDVNWKTFEMNSDKGQSRYGVIAQELEEKHPEFVRTDDEGMKSVAYIDLLIAKIAELEARLEKLEK